MSRWNGKRVFVAYGGESSEREISLRTGQALANALTEAGLAPQLIDVTRATIGALIEARPDVVLVLPWNLREEIVTQLAFVRDWGGRFAVAVPALQEF